MQICVCNIKAELNLLCFFLQIWYYTNGILREAGFAENLLPYITLSTGAIETLAAIISVSIAAKQQPNIPYQVMGVFNTQNKFWT